MIRRVALLIALIFAAIISSPARADAPVQPPDVALSIQPSSLKLPELPPDMVVEEHGWLRIAYPKGTESRVEKTISEADEYKETLSAALGQDVLDHVEIRVARSPDAMAELAPPSLSPPAWAVGVTYPSVHLVLISLVDPTSHEGTDVAEVARHELAHAALDDATSGHHVPLWFNEGVAIHFSGENGLARTNQLWQASMSKSLLPLSDIDTAYPRDRYEVGVAYAESADFVRFLLRDADHTRFVSLIERVRSGSSFDRALADAYGSDLRRLELEWREGLSKRFTIWPALTGGSLIWLLGIGILVVAWMRKKRRAKATLERWEKEEAAEGAFARAEQEPLLDPPVTKHRLTVEHDGRFYTLH
jgi:hypothetical protein